MAVIRPVQASSCSDTGAADCNANHSFGLACCRDGVVLKQRNQIGFQSQPKESLCVLLAKIRPEHLIVHYRFQMLNNTECHNSQCLTGAAATDRYSYSCAITRSNTSCACCMYSARCSAEMNAAVKDICTNSRMRCGDRSSALATLAKFWLRYLQHMIPISNQKLVIPQGSQDK